MSDKGAAFYSDSTNTVILQRQCDTNHENIKRLMARIEVLESSVGGRHFSDPTPAPPIEIQWWEALPYRLMIELWDPVLEAKNSFHWLAPAGPDGPGSWRFHVGNGHLGEALSSQLTELVHAHPVLSLLAPHYGIKPS